MSDAERLSRDPANLEAMWGRALPFYKQLKVEGFSNEIIAAVLGNMAMESSCDATADSGSHSGFFGNQREIKNWIIKNFGGYNSNHQMNYLIAGLKGTLPDTKSLWGDDLYKRFNKFMQSSKNTTNISRLSDYWEKYYEKSGGQELQARRNYANYFYKQILNQPEELEYGPKYTQNGDLNIYLTIDPIEQDNGFTNQILEEVHQKQLKKQQNLPKIPYKSTHKVGGKLIPKGQYGTPLYKDVYVETLFKYLYHLDF